MRLLPQPGSPAPVTAGAAPASSSVRPAAIRLSSAEGREPAPPSPAGPGSGPGPVRPPPASHGRSRASPGSPVRSSGPSNAGTTPPRVAVPLPPPSAAEVFGPALARAEQYAGLLAGPGVERGLIGPHETGRLWERHLLNCAVVEELVPQGASLVDIGSGAGLPGIVLALLRPDLRVTLLEPMARRVTFLGECVALLRLDNVTVHRGRAEETAGQLAAGVATARAVAPLDRLAALALGLIRPGGTVLALKGERAAHEATAAGPALRRLGVTEVTVLSAGAGRIHPATTVIRLIAPGTGRRIGAGPAAGPVSRRGGSGTSGRRRP